MSEINQDYYYVQKESPLAGALLDHLSNASDFHAAADLIVRRLGADSAVIGLTDERYSITAYNFTNENAPVWGWHMNDFGQFEPKGNKVRSPSFLRVVPAVVEKCDSDLGVHKDAHYCLLTSGKILLVNPRTIDNKPRQPEFAEMISREELLRLLSSHNKRQIMVVKDLSSRTWRPAPIMRGSAFHVSAEMEALNKERSVYPGERPLRHTLPVRMFRRMLAL